MPADAPSYSEVRDFLPRGAARQWLHMTRWRLKAENPTLYQRSLAILRRHDPMLIALFDPGEYEPEVDTILCQARTARSRNELLQAIQHEFAWWFGGAVASTPTYDRGFANIASDLWEACEAQAWSRRCQQDGGWDTVHAE